MSELPRAFRVKYEKGLGTYEVLVEKTERGGFVGKSAVKMPILGWLEFGRRPMSRDHARHLYETYDVKAEDDDDE